MARILLKGTSVGPDQIKLDVIDDNSESNNSSQIQVNSVDDKHICSHNNESSLTRTEENPAGQNKEIARDNSHQVSPTMLPSLETSALSMSEQEDHDLTDRLVSFHNPSQCSPRSTKSVMTRMVKLLTPTSLLGQALPEEESISSVVLGPTSGPIDSQTTSNTSENLHPCSLEGTLYFRKGRRPGKTAFVWKQVYVVLNLTDGGSITLFKSRAAHLLADHDSPENQNDDLGRVRSKKSRRRAKFRTAGEDNNSKIKKVDPSLTLLSLPRTANWTAKDVANNDTTFVIEIPSNETLDGDSSDEVSFHGSIHVEDMEINHADSAVSAALQDDLARCKDSKEVFRIYFRCGKKRSHEKVLWLGALSQLGRLDQDTRRQKFLKHLFGDPNLKLSHARMRSAHAQQAAMEKHNFLSFDESNSYLDDPLDLQAKRERKGKKIGEKEYLVYPLYAYPNRWMTKSELYNEMLKPSETFHDLRSSVHTTEREIGTLKVELLQCFGLPALDFASETDAVAYLVCGSYAFTSDVIWNRLNPIWLPKTRRACTFPIFHGYAQLFCGIFDDDGKYENDDFAGRVAVDLARLRPGTTYNITLPLRMSTHVYSREPRGSVRLRISLDWHSERDAILSYIPKKISPPSAGPNNDVTILCADQKAFRNIATTVHGIHMPGRFSFPQWKATMREMLFARKVATNAIIDLMIDVAKWENPAFSAMVFGAWMHCIYRNLFSLVPFYLVFFSFILMIKSYVLYGSDGPIQNGFIPPSFEEIFLALAKGDKDKDSFKFKPLKLDSRSNKDMAACKPETHKQRGKWLFELLGFSNVIKDAMPEDYHMDFAYSQGLQNPYTEEAHYPKFSVKESLVSKAKIAKASNQSIPEEDEDLSSEEGRSDSDAKPASWSLKKPSLTKKKSDRTRKMGSKAGSQMTIRSSGTALERSRRIEIFESLPMRLRIPEQDVTEGPVKKKKLSDELDLLRTNMHKVTFNLFNDRTHVIRRKDATFFGTQTKNVQNDIDRLLNTGQFCSPNPFVSKIGTYFGPIIGASHSGLCATRAVYNIVTWRDPILSFWVTVLLLMVSFVLAIFPYRLLLFVIGVAVVGPQNWIFRVMDERGSTPQFVLDFLEKQKEKKLKKKEMADKEKKAIPEIPTNQPVISAHTDNGPPPQVTLEDVGAKNILEVSVPYSQLNYQRMYDWPPEAQYSNCEPTADVEERRRRRALSISRHSSRPADTTSINRKRTTSCDNFLDIMEG